MADETLRPAQIERRPASNVDIEEHGIDVASVSAAVSAVSSAVSAGAAVYVAKNRNPPPPQDPPAPQSKIELPPGVDRGGDE